MTLLLTRVDEKPARNFARGAKARGHTPHSFLQELVKEAAVRPKPRTWKRAFEWLDSLGIKPVPFGIVAKQRAEDGER